MRSDESDKRVPTGLPDADDDPGRGEHNRLGFFEQDEEQAADETGGQEGQTDAHVPEVEPTTGGPEQGVAEGEPAPLDPDDTEH